jgi:hypothetical protein
MIPYWIMLFLPAWALLTPKKLPSRQQWVGFLLVGAVFVFLMGYRDNVGGDWNQYQTGFDFVSRESFSDAINYGDPGYYALNWLVGQVGGSIFVVNSICALILVAGTIYFCRRLPSPWVGILVAVPYLLIVVGMGYTRQAVALGFAMFGYVAMAEGRILAFVFWIAVGALFHKTALILIPIGALSATQQYVWTIVWISITGGLLYSGLLEGHAGVMWVNYVEAEMESDGALVRVAMNVVPAAIYLFFRNRLTQDPHERRLWTWIALAALICLPALSFPSTAVDRLALYLIPVQMYVFGHLPRLANDRKNRTLLIMGIVVYYALVQWTWLNLATHASGWVPYKNYFWSPAP